MRDGWMNPSRGGAGLSDGLHDYALSVAGGTKIRG